MYKLIYFYYSGVKKISSLELAHRSDNPAKILLSQRFNLWKTRRYRNNLSRFLYGAATAK